MTALQLGLFDTEPGGTNEVLTAGPRFEPGEIVIARVYSGRIIPFWQVRFAQWQDGQKPGGLWGYYAVPVPFGTLPADPHWLYAGSYYDPVSTGLRYRLVSWHELSLWSNAASRAQFAERLNFCVNGFCQPYAEESDLVALMAPLGDWSGWTEENFEQRRDAALKALRGK